MHSQQHPFCIIIIIIKYISIIKYHSKKKIFHFFKNIKISKSNQYTNYQQKLKKTCRHQKDQNKKQKHKNRNWKIKLHFGWFGEF